MFLHSLFGLCFVCLDLQLLLILCRKRRKRRDVKSPVSKKIESPLSDAKGSVPKKMESPLSFLTDDDKLENAATISDNPASALMNRSNSALLQDSMVKIFFISFSVFCSPKETNMKRKRKIETFYNY